MGIIRAAAGAVGGALADQWLEVIEPDNMGEHTVLTCGVSVRPKDKRGQNKKGTADIITNGSVIHVYPNQFMMLVDGGKVVDYTAEEGYYQVENAGAPSLFGGQFGEALEESFRRIQYGGVPSGAQKYILSIYRRSRESDLAHGIPLTISIKPIMRSCFCVPMALTLSKSRIPCAFMPRRCRATGIEWRSRILMNSISPNSWRLCRRRSIRCRPTGYVFHMCRRRAGS